MPQRVAQVLRCVGLGWVGLGCVGLGWAAVGLTTLGLAGLC